MENASKALIIAGSILLAIAIIGIGVYVYRQAAGTVNNTRLTSQQIDAYNSEFSQYGGKQNGATVRAMLDRVRTHNSLNSDDTSRIIVVVMSKLDGGIIQRGDGANDSDATPQHIAEIKNKIQPGSIYEVTFRYTTGGLIKAIGISSASK